MAWEKFNVASCEVSTLEALQFIRQTLLNATAGTTDTFDDERDEALNLLAQLIEQVQ